MLGKTDLFTNKNNKKKTKTQKKNKTKNNNKQTKEANIITEYSAVYHLKQSKKISKVAQLLLKVVIFLYSFTLVTGIYYELSVLTVTCILLPEFIKFIQFYLIINL